MMSMMLLESKPRDREWLLRCESASDTQTKPPDIEMQDGVARPLRAIFGLRRLGLILLR
jgi:hypothetical protein